MSFKITIQSHADYGRTTSIELVIEGSLESDLVCSKALNEIAKVHLFLDALESKDTVISIEDLEKDKRDYPETYPT